MTIPATYALTPRFYPSESWEKVWESQRVRMQSGEYKLFPKQSPVFQKRTECVLGFFPDTINRWLDDLAHQVLSQPDFDTVLFVPTGLTHHTTLQWAEPSVAAQEESASRILEHVRAVLAQCPISLKGPYINEASVNVIIDIDEQIVKAARAIIRENWHQVFASEVKIDERQIFGMWSTLLRYHTKPDAEMTKKLLSFNTVYTSPEFVLTDLHFTRNDFNVTKPNLELIA